MSEQTQRPASTPVTITLNGVEITGTVKPLAPGRAFFVSSAGSALELYVGGPAQIFETKGGEAVASVQTQ